MEKSKASKLTAGYFNPFIGDFYRIKPPSFPLLKSQTPIPVLSRSKISYELRLVLLLNTFLRSSLFPSILWISSTALQGVLDAFEIEIRYLSTISVSALSAENFGQLKTRCLTSSTIISHVGQYRAVTPKAIKICALLSVSA